MTEKVLKRKCSVCGEALKILLKKKRAYSGGYYFGKMNLPIGKGEYRKVGKFKFGKMKGNVVKWIGKEKKFEYWECEKCFKED